MSHRNSRPSYQALGSFQNDRNQVPADQNKVTETKVSFEFLVQNTHTHTHNTILTFKCLFFSKVPTSCKTGKHGFLLPPKIRYTRLEYDFMTFNGIRIE